MFGGKISGLGEYLFEFFVCKHSRLFQTVRGSLDFHGDIAVRSDDFVEIVLVNDLLRYMSDSFMLMYSCWSSGVLRYMLLMSMVIYLAPGVEMTLLRCILNVSRLAVLVLTSPG